MNPSLQLPEENEFIPTDFSIRERPQDVSTVKYSILYMSSALEQYLNSWFSDFVIRDCKQSIYLVLMIFLSTSAHLIYFLTDKSVNQYFSYLYVAFIDSHSYKGM